MLYPRTEQERLFSLSARDWLSKAFLASGVGSKLPIYPNTGGGGGSTEDRPLLWQSTRYQSYPGANIHPAYPQVVGLPYRMGRKSNYKAGIPSSQGDVKSLPQRLRDSFLDGSLNLPDQCLWHMEMSGNCHDPHFKLKSSLSGKYLVHPNMAGNEKIFGGISGGLDGGEAKRHVGLVLSHDKFTPLTFASGLSTDKVSRWSGWPMCAGDQNIGSSQRKTCIAEHTCLQCATGYADCNTACADPSVPHGTTGEPSAAALFNMSGVKWGGADVCHRAPVVVANLNATHARVQPQSTCTGLNCVQPASVVIALQVQQHRKDVVAPQLFNITLTYERPGISSAITRSHLLAYESDSSIALEQIKGVPCAGPITVTAAACVEGHDSRVDCNFPATRKVFSNPCPAATADGVDAPVPAPTQAPEVTPVRPAADTSDSLRLPAHPATAITLAPSQSVSPSPLAAASASSATPRPKEGVAPSATGSPASRASLPSSLAARYEDYHLTQPAEIVVGLSLVLLLGSASFFLVRRLFRPTLRSEKLLDEVAGEASGGPRYDKRPAASNV